MEYTRAQMKELLTNYGPIDYFFFDGPADKLTDYAWQLQPKLINYARGDGNARAIHAGRSSRGPVGRKFDDGDRVAVEADE